MKGYVSKHNTTYTFQGIQTLTPEGFNHTTSDMWRGFCRHVVDIEKEYFEKDGLVEDRVEEMIIHLGDEDSDDSDDEDDLIDEHDRQMIDNALRDTSVPVNPSDICTDPRQLETNTAQTMDQHFLDSILPLP